MLASARALGLVVLASVLAGHGRDAVAASAGPQPGMTGAPAIGAEAAEGTCVSCHNSFVLNPDDLGKVTLSGAPSAYEPGRIYPLEVAVSHSDASVLRWGFQMTAVALASGGAAGSFLVVDPARTQVVSAVAGGREYVEPTYEGTAIGQPHGASWTFQWKAPAADVGEVAFFVAANCSNVDGSNQGDRIYSPSPRPIATMGPQPAH